MGFIPPQSYGQPLQPCGNDQSAGQFRIAFGPNASELNLIIAPGSVQLTVRRDTPQEQARFDLSTIRRPAPGRDTGDGLVLDPGRATSATALEAPAGPVAPGTAVTLTARVEGADGATPAGTVLSRNGPDPRGEAALAGGVATLSAARPVGTHRIAATCQGGTTHTPASSAPVPHRVIRPAAGRNEFAGGGAVFSVTAAGAPAGRTDPVRGVRRRHAPGEVNGMPTQTAILWPTGAEHLQVRESFAPTTQVFTGFGRQLWSFFVRSRDRPRLRRVERRITMPANGTGIRQAPDVRLRLRVANRGGGRGGAATLAGVRARMAGG
jgi:hypothetical protein